MDRSKQLGENKVSSLLWAFSIPAIFGMLVNAFYNVIDRVFVGRGVGSLGIAGMTIGFPIMIVQMAFSMLIGIGANALVSIRLGEQRRDDAEAIIGNALTLLVVIGVILALLGILFIDPLLRAFGASAAVLPYARDYLHVILIGSVFQSIGMGMNNFIRAEGNPRVAMFTMLLGAITNAVLAPVFIFHLGWGVKGAAIATVIAQAATAAWVLHYFLAGRSSLRIHSHNLCPRLPIVQGICAIGMAPFAMQLAGSVIQALMNNSLVRYGGDVAISAVGIVGSIAMLIVMPIFGINQGAQPIIGYNYGARQFDRVRETLRLAIGAATVLVVIGFVVAEVFPAQIISLFNNKDAELVRVGALVLRVFMIFLPIIGFQIVSANYFQAVGKAKMAMLLSLSRQVLLLIPALLILPPLFGFNGLLAAIPLADLGSSILTAVMLAREFRHLDLRHANEQASLEPTGRA